MTDKQQHNKSSVDTNKIPKVTQEMLDKFTDPVNEVPEPVAEISESPSEDKTVVEFSEDKTEEELKPAKPKKFGFFLKGFLVILLIAFVGTAIFGIWNRWFRYDDEADLISN